MLNDLIKGGNLLRYVGNLTEYYDKVGLVLSIDKTCDGEDSFLLKVLDYKKQEHEIQAYNNEVWPITLAAEHLHKMGFIKDNERNVFSLETLVLIRPIFIKHEAKGSSYIDKGFVVVEKKIELPLKESDVDAYTSPVTSLHTLQNYVEGKLVRTRRVCL